MITVILNGKKESLDASMSIADLLRQKNIRPEVVTVEHNDDILTRADFQNKTVNDNDRIEFVYFMGGGRNAECRLWNAESDRRKKLCLFQTK